MTLILILGTLLTVWIASDDRLDTKDKFLMVVTLAIIMGLATLF